MAKSKTETGFGERLMFIEDMQRGQEFLDVHGDRWRFERQHGGNRGAYVARRLRDGFRSCFAGVAQLRVDDGPAS